MATVRALERCYFNHRVYEPGAEFEYDGPQQQFLQLVDGQWTKKQLRNNTQALEAENEQLRRRLAELEAKAADKEAAGAADKSAADKETTGKEPEKKKGKAGSGSPASTQ